MKRTATDSAGKTRSNIAILISEIEGEYANLVCRGTMDACQELDLNLIVCAGKSIKSPYQYQYQFNVLYDIIRQNQLDGLILASGVLFNYSNAAESKSFIKRFGATPIVNISIPLENRPSVLIRNSPGLEQVLQHLITVHGKTRIAFITGPQANSEAQERLAVYRQVLAKNQLAFDEALVLTGDFSRFSGVQAIETLLQRQVAFDAVAAANDEMALFALKTLQENGYRVPQDVAVTGFDNVESAATSSPPLTTVKQPVYQQAKQAVNLLSQLLAGETPENVYLETEAVFRGSCGCQTRQTSFDSEAEGISHLASLEHNLSQKITNASLAQDQINLFVQEALALNSRQTRHGDVETEILDKFLALIASSQLNHEDVPLFQTMLELLERDLLARNQPERLPSKLVGLYRNLQTKLLEGVVQGDTRRWNEHHVAIRALRHVLNLMIVNINSAEDSLDSIIPELKAIHIKSACAFVYPEALGHGRNQEWVTPAAVKIGMAFDGDETGDSRKKTVMETRQVARLVLPDDRRTTLVMNPLFFMEEQFGFWFCEMELSDSFILESLTVEIGCALKLNQVIGEHQKMESELKVTLDKLESFNQKLSNLSQTDELTGLYNRRGFLQFAAKSLSLARRMGKCGTVFFVDLDGLKRINDNFGHDEGDWAIKKSAGVLTEAFRNADIIARLGGDEFTIFSLNTNEGFVKVLCSRIEQLLDLVNQSAGKPYKLAMSIGAVWFNHDSNESIETLLEQADARLYQQKKAKKLN